MKCTTMFFVFINLICSSCLFAQQENMREYKLGENGPAGGIVFYDKGEYTDGWRYFEISPIDQSKSIKWYAGSPANTLKTIGAGYSNTQKITEYSKEEIGSYAASICKMYTINNFSDWFLPSLEELSLIYVNLKQKEISNLSNDWYWSSSEGGFSNGYAWGIDFKDGKQSTRAKGGENSVRAIRMF